MTQGSDLDKGSTTFGAGSSAESQAAVQKLQDIVEQAQSSSNMTTAGESQLAANESPLAERWKPVLQSSWVRKFLPTLSLSLVLYSVMFGWWGGLVIMTLITIHEMGHWIWMRANNCDPQAPVYVPLLGAFVLMRQPPEDEATAAWVSLAGPLVGGTGAGIMYLAGILLHDPMLTLGGAVGFLLNLTQLLPARPFDGGNVVAAISKYILIPGMLALIAMAISSRSPLLFLFSIISIISYFNKPTRPGPKLVHSGKAKTILELERELLNSNKTLATLSAANAQPANRQATSSQSKLIPATVGQRWAIGVSYVALMAGLAGLMTSSIWEIGSHLRSYASVGVTCLTNMMRLREESGLLVQRSYLYALQNNFPAAQSDIERALRINQNDRDGYLCRATYKLLQKQNDQSVAIDLIKSSQLSKNESLEAWNASFALVLCGDYDLALQSMNRLSPAAAAGIRALILQNNGHPEEAAAYYNESVSKSKPMYWGPRLRRAFYYLSTNQIGKAKDDLAVLNQRPLRPPVIGLLGGWCDLKDGNLSQAIKQADNALTNRIEDLDLLHSAYMNAACHRLKAEAYARQALCETNPSLADNFKRMSAAERERSDKIPGFGAIYIPSRVESWK